MSAVGLVVHQFRYDQRTFWRDPTAVFFTVALPLVFLFLFVSIFGNGNFDTGGRRVRGSTYYVPGILTLSIVSATMANLAVTLTSSRERGTLKRLRSTPLPPWVLLAGRVGTAGVVTLVLVVLVTGLGRLVYGVNVPTSTLPALLVTVMVGAAAGCCLGFALTAVIPSENAAPAVTNAITLPLYFISGVFIRSEDIPEPMQRIADLFPVKHLFQALLTAFDPGTSGAGFEWGHLALLGAWGVVGLAVAARAFQWAPRRST